MSMSKRLFLLHTVPHVKKMVQLHIETFVNKCFVRLRPYMLTYYVVTQLKRHR